MKRPTSPISPPQNITSPRVNTHNPLRNKKILKELNPLSSLSNFSFSSISFIRQVVEKYWSGPTRFTKTSNRIDKVVIALQKVNKIRLPTKFVGNDKFFRQLLQNATYYYNQKNGKVTTNGKVTSLQLWNFIQKEGSNPLSDYYKVASHFKKNYTETEVRVLPKKWSYVYVTTSFLAKQLSNYYSKNSPQHKVFLNSIGC